MYVEASKTGTVFIKRSIKVAMAESLYIETPVYRYLGQLYYNVYCETHNQQPFTLLTSLRNLKLLTVNRNVKYHPDSRRNIFFCLLSVHDTMSLSHQIEVG